MQFLTRDHEKIPFPLLQPALESSEFWPSWTVAFRFHCWHWTSVLSAQHHFSLPPNCTVDLGFDEGTALHRHRHRHYHCRWLQMIEKCGDNSAGGHRPSQPHNLWPLPSQRCWSLTMVIQKARKMKDGRQKKIFSCPPFGSVIDAKWTGLKDASYFQKNNT